MRGKSIFGIAMLVAILASLFTAIPVPAQALPRMYIKPSSIDADGGAIITLSVHIENVVDLYAYEFKIGYNITYLIYIPSPLPGPFLGKDGNPTFFAWTVNEQAGILRCSETRIGHVPGVSGNGRITQSIKFRVDVVGAGKNTTLDLYDEIKLDSSLSPIVPQGEPGDCALQIRWPPWLWNTELWLSAAKGGKIWTDYQVGGMTRWWWNVTELFGTPFPYYWNCSMGISFPGSDYWDAQTVYARVRNTGTATEALYIRARLDFMDMVTGEVSSMTTAAGLSRSGETVVLEAQAGLIDPLAVLIWGDPGDFPPELCKRPGTFAITGELQISLDGWNWFDWTSFDPPLPGDGRARDVPGGSTGKFKVTSELQELLWPPPGIDWPWGWFGPP